jgi:hypothetical protein
MNTTSMYGVAGRDPKPQMAEIEEPQPRCEHCCQTAQAARTASKIAHPGPPRSRSCILLVEEGRNGLHFKRGGPPIR